MKPITKGSGKECYTLYFPFSILRTATEFDIETFVTKIKNALEKISSLINQYKIRSALANAGAIREDFTEEFHRANQFVHFAAKALLKHGLDLTRPKK